MLTTTKNITLAGQSTIDGTAAERYTAVINSEKPADMTISAMQVNKALYKENRTLCRQDRADFEEAAYALQDELTANLETTTSEAEEGEEI